MKNFFQGTLAEPREYQERICQKTVDMMEGNWVAKDGTKPRAAQSILIDAPTGSGKTVIALAIAQYGNILGKRIGFVAMRRNLLRQSKEMRDKFGFNIPDMKFISMFDSSPTKDIDWLIIDEAHHLATTSMSHICEEIKPEKIIGLSATPFRTDRAQLVFERTIKDIGIHSLIKDGYLSEYDHYTLQNYSPESIAIAFKNHKKRWGKSIVFFRTMEECTKMMDLFQKIGIRTDIVWRNSNREDQIDKFREDKIEVLISMTILTEGFDLEELQTTFVRPSSKLPTMQMGGRVLRKHSALQAKQIVQCQDTEYPFVKVAKPRISYIQFDDDFRSLEQNKNIEKVSKIYSKKILKTEIEIPKFLEFSKKKTISFRRPGQNPTRSPRNRRGRRGSSNV